MRGTNLVLASLAVALTAVSASAQTRWNHSVTVKASDYDPAVAAGGVAVLQLAADESLALTDVVMTHNISTTANTFRANIRRGPASNPTPCSSASLVLGPYVSPAETVSLNLSTGIAFGPGEQICIVIGGASGSEGVTFSFSGLKSN